MVRITNVCVPYTWFRLTVLGSVIDIAFAVGLFLHCLLVNVFKIGVCLINHVHIIKEAQLDLLPQC